MRFMVANLIQILKLRSFNLPVFEQLLGCRKGAAAIEFAFAGLLLITITVGIVEVAMASLVHALVEGGVRQASRFGITGQLPDGFSREQAIITEIGRNTHGLVSVGPEQVEVLVYPSFADIGQPEPFLDTAPANGVYDPGETYTDVNGNSLWDSDMGLAGAGGPSDIVVYRVTYTWSTLTGLLNGVFGPDIVMQASIAVRNEPF